MGQISNGMTSLVRRPQDREKNSSWALGSRGGFTIFFSGLGLRRSHRHTRHETTRRDMEPPEMIDPGDDSDARGVEFSDLVDGDAQVDLDDTVVAEGGGVLVPATVKMKLNTFLRTDTNTRRIKAKLNDVVLDGNRLLGEAYAFANFHVGRLLEADIDVPVIDRNFYYRCLLAVCDSNCRADTLG